MQDMNLLFKNKWLNLHPGFKMRTDENCMNSCVRDYLDQSLAITPTRQAGST